MKKDRMLLSLSGLSGVGKSSVSKVLMEKYGFDFSVSTTTRLPRADEEHGRHYYFVSKDEFEARLKEDAFIEHTHFSGNYYGTALSELEKTDHHLLFDLEYTEMAKKNLPEIVWCLLQHDDKTVLKQRLIERAKENANDTYLDKRLKHIDEKVFEVSNYDFCVNVTEKTPETIADDIVGSMEKREICCE